MRTTFREVSNSVKESGLNPEARGEYFGVGSSPTFATNFLMLQSTNGRSPDFHSGSASFVRVRLPSAVPLLCYECREVVASPTGLLL